MLLPLATFHKDLPSLGRPSQSLPEDARMEKRQGGKRDRRKATRAHVAGAQRMDDERFLPGRRKGGAALATSRATPASAVPRNPSRGVVRRQEAAS